MSELEERLNAVLNDPQQMAQIAEMASSLMGSIAPEGGASPPQRDDGVLSLAEKLAKEFSSGTDQQRLLRGLAPYLSEERRQRLEKALRFSSAAKLVSAVFPAEGGGEGK